MVRIITLVPNPCFMSLEEKQQGSAHLQVSNIGGISDTTVELAPGVTVLSGRNATNRTSLLQAIMAACGSDRATLKGDVDEGHVELTFNGDTYTRQLTRTDTNSVSFSGNPYLDDVTGGDLFAFLLETNEVREAVERGDNLRDIIMRPVDTEAIQAEITRLEQEKRDLDQEIEKLDNLEQRLPQLENQRTQLESDIDEKQDELTAKEADLEAADATVEESRKEKADLDAKLDELRDARSRLEDIRYDIETQQESLDQLHDTREELETEFEELPELAGEDQKTEIASEIKQLDDRKSSIEADLNDLQRLIQFNEGMLEDEESREIGTLTSDDETTTTDEPVTDQLLAENEQLTCWTCGSDVDRDQINETIDRLREFRQEKLSRISALEDEIDELKKSQQERRTARQRRDELEQRLNETKTEIDDRKATLANLEDEREDLKDQVSTLETDVEELEDEAYTELLDLHKEVNELEFELNRLESQLDDVTAEIAEIEDKIAQRDDLTNQREVIQDELEDQRTRIEHLESQAVEEFNQHMETVLDLLEYKNIERIWLDRRETQVREGRRKVEKTIFDLHVARRTTDGATYEDTVEHLSESEREVTGLVLALAGYLTHELYETLPFMLLDSIEALDSERIAALVDYLHEYAHYLVVALLPEDAEALDDDFTYITEL